MFSCYWLGMIRFLFAGLGRSLIVKTLLTTNKNRTQSLTSNNKQAQIINNQEQAPDQAQGKKGQKP
ncbi:MAG TPA: hypothetical protein DEG17_26225 [Cyanobacteria bacterium UBA11149]|nr:hypothetical protein [Cyanobacteria bacterium UBA11367]HBK63094.1 hypothetical protein [Cyanobacteria bacterium UBA11166]HBR76092.1 hypothetical protein [Cyanobacteria bacterium UBA11159]HBS69524.1 hypothetical protein [Cyanobacteria bacterium UBA11153]HBW92267.1 hypothetical protein [Cyanobacteria bacterium UBA11149]HCA93830.1 hypothetical protein [Cyanobacteria bacterium UBA9226]